MKRLVLATHNRDKIVEIVRALEGLPLEVVSVADGLTLPDVEETGETLEANALLKARAIAEATGDPALADDTGLEVAALDGAPGVYSARYAGEGATYADNVGKLVDALAGVPRGRRGARFRTVVAFVTPDGHEETVDGVCDGDILAVPQGDGGFGYDPIFRPEGETRSFAEMSLDEKNQISHRGRAVTAARVVLEKWCARRDSNAGPAD